MENSIEEEFRKKFVEIIDNSFFEFEREDFLNSLKVLGLKIDDVILLLLDDLSENLDVNRTSLDINLGNLPKSNVFNRFKLAEIEDVKSLNAIQTFIKGLHSIFVLFSDELKRTDTERYNSMMIGYENNKSKIRDRFSYDENQKTEYIFLQQKGHHSFILKNKPSLTKLREMWIQLKSENLISKKTNYPQIEAVFSGNIVEEEQKIDWNTYRDIYFFVLKIKPYLLHKNDVYETATRCFTCRGETIVDSKKLTKSSGGDKNLKTISDIINNLYIHFD